MRGRIGRTLPPAIAPISFRGIISGVMAMFRGDSASATFVNQLKKHFNVKHCFLLSSGKASLTQTLQVLKELHPDRDEVLIPAFTCYSVPAAITRAGLKIRICDIEPETLDFDYQELSGQMDNQRLLSVIPTHLFGVSADVPRVREMIGTRTITIVEDAAQSMGAEFNGIKVGTLGDVGLFSLGRGKAFSTVSGGVILTNSDIIGNALSSHYETIAKPGILNQLMLVGYAVALSVLSRPELFWIPKSLPFLGLGETHFDPDFSIKRLSAFQSGLAGGWQNRLLKLRTVRRKHAAYLFNSGINPAGGSKLLASDMIRFPVILASAAEKASVLGDSDQLGFGGAEAYPGTIDSIAKLQGSIVGGTSAKARMIVEGLVTFPLHPYVTETDLDNIAGLLRRQQPKLK